MLCSWNEMQAELAIEASVDAYFRQVSEGRGMSSSLVLFHGTKSP